MALCNMHASYINSTYTIHNMTILKGLYTHIFYINNEIIQILVFGIFKYTHRQFFQIHEICCTILKLFNIKLRFFK